MPEEWSVNWFFDPEKTKGLYEAMASRESCRSFASRPSAEQWEALRASTKAFALPGVRLEVGFCDAKLFAPFFGLLMKFENVGCFAAVITRDEKAESIVNAGISGEMLMLEAVKQGLAGCWVAGTYKRKQVGMTLETGEKVRALIALGVPQVTHPHPLTRKRKPLSQLCSPNYEEAPPVFREVAKVVRIAPSAINLQPWRMTYLPEDQLEISVKLASQRLDLGIAVCHGVLAVGKTPMHYTLSEDGLGARLTLR